jgi:hypothetical protein
MDRAIYIFQSGQQDLYGLTHDRSGANLPAENGAWHLIRAVEMDGGLPQWGVEVAWQEQEAAVKAGLGLNGFFITEGANLPETLRDKQTR